MNNQEHKQKKKHGEKRFIIPLLLSVFCFGFLFSAYKFFSTAHENRKSDEAYTELRTVVQEQHQHQMKADAADDRYAEQLKPEMDKAEPEAESRAFSLNISALKKIYPELVAWVLAGEIGIDYPIMHTENNEYYLDHLYDGTPNANGALFVDYRNAGVFTDDNTVIYGHNMKNGSMLSSINKFKSQEFYEAHPTMIICTEDGNYLVELISGTVEDGNYEFVRFMFDSFEEMNDYVADIRNRSTFESLTELKPGDKLVSFCTCTYDRQNARYMLVGKISKH